MPSEKNSPLLRQIGFLGATALVVSNMVGTGIFTSTGFLAGDLGQVNVILGIWVVGAICALAGALCYSELGINYPSSGGEYVYLTQAFGPTWGFMCGWISFFAGFSAPIALTSLAFSEYVSYFFPAVRQSNSATFGPAGFQLQIGPAQYLACGLIGVFTLLNFFGVKRVARIQTALTGVKLVVILSFIVLGLFFGKGDWANFAKDAVRTSPNTIPEQFLVSLVWIYVGYSGWNAATYVAEEIRKPEETLPRALAFGTLLVTVLFLLLNVVFIYAVPLEQMKGVLAVGTLTAKALFGPEIAGIFGAFMAMSLMATVNAMVTIGPRVYYAMAKNKAFFSFAAEVNEKWRTPVNAIVMQGICSMLMTMTPFTQLLTYIGFLLNIFTVLAVASLFVFRGRPGWQKLGILSFGWPAIPAFYVIAGSLVTFYALRVKPEVSLAGALTMAVGAAAFHFSGLAKRGKAA